MTLCGWCIANQCDRRGPGVHHETCPCANPCHENTAANGADETSFALLAWENGARPQGASTPAASNHPSLTKNERG